jgi:hypothetical protein
MDTPDEAPKADGLQDYDTARLLWDNGTPPAELRQKLVKVGLDPQRAADLVNRLVAYEEKRKLHPRAAYLLRRGDSVKEARLRLIAEGFDPKAVVLVLDEVLEERARERKEDGGPALRVLVIVVLLVGVGLLVGNTTGAFVTFPYAGGIVLALGAVLFAMGRAFDRAP